MAVMAGVYNIVTENDSPWRDTFTFYNGTGTTKAIRNLTNFSAFMDIYNKDVIGDSILATFATGEDGELTITGASGILSVDVPRETIVSLQGYNMRYELHLQDDSAETPAPQRELKGDFRLV